MERMTIDDMMISTAPIAGESSMRFHLIRIQARSKNNI